MNPDDPKLTAYALGELSEEEAIEFERILAQDKGLREAVDEIRETADTVLTALGGEVASALTSEQEEQIITTAIEGEAGANAGANAEAEAKIVRVPFYRNATYLSMAAAAVMLLSILGALTVFNDIRKADEIARNNKKSVYIVDTPTNAGVDLTKPPPSPLPEAVEVARVESQVEAVVDFDFDSASPGEAVTVTAGGGNASVPEAVAVAKISLAGDISSDETAISPGFDIGGTEIDELRGSYDLDDAEGLINGAENIAILANTVNDESLGVVLDGNLSSVPEQEIVIDLDGGGRRRSEKDSGSLSSIKLDSYRKQARNSDEGRYSFGEIQEFASDSLNVVTNSGVVTTAFPILPPESPPPYPMPTPVPGGEFNTEVYDSIVDNPFLMVERIPLSTFSIDVDTAAYANIRRFLTANQRPPKDAVRIEELVNYFPYEYALPEENEHPLKINVEAASAPWQAEHRLVRVALKGKEIDWEERAASNVVFLLDVSGSMNSPNKLPLVKRSMELLTRKFGQRDRVAIVTYAGQSQVALPSTTADNTETVLHAIRNLNSGGSTHASAGIEDAYKIAEKHFIKGGNNRVILCTDGDFNVGVTNRGKLVDIIEAKAKKGIFLTILGFGMGNYKDSTLEELSNKGNGNYGYIDSLREARKVFVEQVAGTMMTIAKDVKIQVEFNPAKVQAYRLIGYENRHLEAQDFNDDKKDAGEIGAGHTVTAFYEVVPTGIEWEAPGIDPLKYQKPAVKPRVTGSEEMLTVKLRYKQPEADTSSYLDLAFVDSGKGFEEATEDFRFAAGVAAFGMVLRDSPFKGTSAFAMVRSIAENAQGKNRGGYRSEFLYLIDQAEMVTQ